MARKAEAYSLVEVILVVLFIGIFAAITVPRLSFAIISKNKAETTAKKIVTDLRRTRRMAISDAADNTDGFELKMLGGGPYDSYQIENRDTSEVLEVHEIDSAVTVNCSDDEEFSFEPLGNRKGSEDGNITVSAEGKTFTIAVVRATGMIKCTEN
ncbi:MAG: pilus assembly FimT family protein [Planctomycetota bacterium]|jgi:Tfp pilus assembly protein FimT